ncbi:Hematopoietic progenitor cell antigen CD34 isoform X3 [Aix galericulata]|nr:Hematopoietic progenitor cell antigen CD34 isoform X3 [Aix galericulata]
MLFWRSFKIMKWRQLFWIAFCVVKLSGTTADSLTDAPAPAAPSTETDLSGTGSLTATGAPGSTMPTSESLDTARPAAATPSSPGLSTVQTSPQLSSQPSEASTQVRGTTLEDASIGVPMTLTPEVDTSKTEATQEGTLAPLSSTATSELTPVLEASTEPHVASSVPKPISCHNVKDVSDTGAICLRLNESNTCKQFLEMKGSDLWSAICKDGTRPAPSPCHIKLAKSEVDHDCLLLILVNETVRNKIPSARECEEPPGLFSEDPDCFGHFWPLAGVPGHGRILPDEAAELEPRGTEAG